jgi:hypothetical protein
LNAAGDRLAVGAYWDWGNPNTQEGKGAVYLFSFTDGDFSGATLQSIVGAGYSGGKNVNISQLYGRDVFGIAVSLNAAGDRLAVGATGDDGQGGNVLLGESQGAVYLISFSDTNFSGGVLESVIGKGYTGGKNIDVAALEVGDGFGAAVALNAAGDRLAVGAYGDDGFGNSTFNAGAAYLFSFSDGNFSGGVLEGIIGKGYTGGKNFDVAALEVNPMYGGFYAFYPVEGDGFGSSLSFNAAGDRLVVGARNDFGYDNLSGDQTGAVYLFSFSDVNYNGATLEGVIGSGYSGGKNVDVSNLEGGTVIGSTLYQGDGFGMSVSLNAEGDRLVVGAPV